MAKGFVVMNISTACMACSLCYKAEMIYIGEFKYRQLYKCGKEPDYIEDGFLEDILYKKPDWCPIKSVPEYQHEWRNDADWERGYNACIDCILEGEDE